MSGENDNTAGSPDRAPEPSPNTPVMDDIENWFSFHPLTEADRLLYEHIRDEAKAFAYLIAGRCPASRERTVALRKLREVMMYANASVACNPPALQLPEKWPR